MSERSLFQGPCNRLPDGVVVELSGVDLPVDEITVDGDEEEDTRGEADMHEMARR